MTGLFVFTGTELLCVHLVYLMQTTIYDSHLFKQILHLMNSALVSSYNKELEDLSLIQVPLCPSVQVGTE